MIQSKPTWTGASNQMPHRRTQPSSKLLSQEEFCKIFLCVTQKGSGAHKSPFRDDVPGLDRHVCTWRSPFEGCVRLRMSRTRVETPAKTTTETKDQTSLIL